MPQATGNTMTFTITPQGCLSQHPRPLRILTGSAPGSVDRIVLVGDPQNTRNVTVSFDSEQTEAVFNPPPPDDIELPPGGQVVLHIRHDLGLKPRGTFVDDGDPTFQRTIAFVDTDPEPCGSGDLNDVVIESGN